MKVPTAEGAAVTVLPGFEPMKVLWSGDAPLYPSEAAARWALFTMRSELVKEGAVALHRRRVLIHPERYAAVIERRALQQFGEQRAWE